MDRIEELLNKPYWIIDVLPMQVPKNNSGQYFVIEKYYRKERLYEIRKKHIDVVLKLNCYRDISIDGEINPDPEQIKDKMCEQTVYVFTEEAMILSEPDDTHMTIFNPDEELLELLRDIACGEGLYVWKPAFEQSNRKEAGNNRYFEKTEENIYIDNRRITPDYCHAYISNISFPSSLEELEDIFTNEYSEGLFDIEYILENLETTWTAPRWAMSGDICFFMHAKTARITISALKTELNKRKLSYSESDYEKLLAALSHGKELHKKYGGKIFAVARVIDAPEDLNEDSDRTIHWKTRIYSKMGNIWLLKEPIDILDFKNVVKLSSRGAITPVYGEEYTGLRQLILDKNPNPPEYLLASVAADIETGKINRENWIRIASQYRHSFIYEKQLRIYFVDYLLSAIGDIKTIYSECRCVKNEITDTSRVDNVIKFYGRYLPVEVKLVFPDDDSLMAQVTKYCNDDEVYLDKEEKRGVRKELLYYNHVLLIDRDYVRLYDDHAGRITDVFELDDLKSISDIEGFRKKLSEILLTEYETN